MPTRYEEMQADVQAFHKQHPQVWELFVRFSFDRINMGFEHYSAQAIFERIRWETDQARIDNPDVQFKLNNNHVAFYARRFMMMYPKYNGFFRIRVQLSKAEQATGRDPLTPDYFNNQNYAGAQ